MIGVDLKRWKVNVGTASVVTARSHLSIDMCYACILLTPLLIQCARPPHDVIVVLLCFRCCPRITSCI